jgi:hypothetical protein
MEVQTISDLAKVYVASRASVPLRGQMWRKLRSMGVPITSTWIDEDGEGQSASLSELWDRIVKEIAAADYLILYAEASDFPLEGALIEAGVALGMGKPIFVCLPDVDLDPRSMRPIGSWISHPLVTRVDTIEETLLPAWRLSEFRKGSNSNGD